MFPHAVLLKQVTGCGLAIRIFKLVNLSNHVKPARQLLNQFKFRCEWGILNNLKGYIPGCTHDRFPLIIRNQFTRSGELESFFNWAFTLFLTSTLRSTSVATV